MKRKFSNGILGDFQLILFISKTSAWLNVKCYSTFIAYAMVKKSTDLLKK